MPTKGKPNSKVKNDLGNERHYGPDGKATHDVDWGHPQRHPDLPVHIGMIGLGMVINLIEVMLMIQMKQQRLLLVQL